MAPGYDCAHDSGPKTTKVASWRLAVGQRAANGVSIALSARAVPIRPELALHAAFAQLGSERAVETLLVAQKRLKRLWNGDLGMAG
jgi:hypothetical protein